MEPESPGNPAAPASDPDLRAAAGGDSGAAGSSGARAGRDRGPALEVVFAALSSSLLFSLFLLFPGPGFPSFAVAGVPLVRVTHRHGFLAGLLGAAVAVGLLCGIGAAAGGASDAVAGGLLAAVTMGLPVLCTGLVRRGLSASAAFLLLAVSGFAILGGGLLIRQQMGGADVGAEIAAVFDAVTPATGTAAAKGVDPDTAARVAATMTRFKEFVQTYWPGILGALWALAAGVAFYAGAFAARPALSAEKTRFEQLRLPAPAVVLFVAAGAGFALLPQAGRVVAGDVLLPLLALYFLTGLSIICHFARRWFRARILRAGLYALVVYFPLNVGVGLLGLFDWYADFRRKGEKAGDRA